MFVKTLFTTRIRRYACAVLASFVTTFIALNASPIAAAQTNQCNWQDVAAWQKSLTESSQEQTPEYILRVTEAFIAACPNRPEVRDASRIAGIAASDMGEPSKAVDHFNNALPMWDVKARFYEISALLADGKSRTAWQARDELVEDWLDELAREPKISVVTNKVRGGEIHAVTFAQRDQETGIGAAWVAVPDGPGWPATLTIGSERQLTAFHKIRTGADLRHVDLYRCRGRRILARVDAAMSVGEMDISAETTLVAYLARPDRFERTEKGEPISVCIWPKRILPPAPR
ncbi:MAG: hypothetical protein ABNH53_02185 [Henriciella sp.]|jgi:hypothetical protein